MKIENFQRKPSRQKNDGASKNFSAIFGLFIMMSETNRDIISQNLTMGSIVIVVFFQISAKHCDRFSSYFDNELANVSSPISSGKLLPTKCTMYVACSKRILEARISPFFYSLKRRSKELAIFSDSYDQI